MKCSCNDNCQNNKSSSNEECERKNEDVLNETFDIKRVKIENDENHAPNSPKRQKLSNDIFECTSPSYPSIKQEYIFKND